MKQRQTLRLPLLSCLNQGSVARALRGDRLIIEVDIMQHGLVERCCGSEVGSGDDLMGPAMVTIGERLNPADEAMGDGQGGLLNHAAQ